jgi:hypothetical protein
MASSRKRLLGAGIVITVSAGVAWLGLEALGRGLCGNEILVDVPSPARDHKAVVFQRNCGATTGFSTQVSVLPFHKRLPAESGNVFVADTDHGRAEPGPGRGPAVEVTWLNAQELLVLHDAAARVFRAENTRGTVRVVYRTQ